MNIDFNLSIKTILGELLKSDGRALLLSEACAESLMFEPALPSLSGAEKVKRYKLAMRLIEGGQQDVSEDERERILASSEKRWAPLVYGQIHEALEDTE